MQVKDLIGLKRIYAPSEPEDGARYLVERLWPRGIRKEYLPLRDWLKDIAPSDALRRWFAHDVAKWDEFQRRYLAELADKTETLHSIVHAAHRERVTLLYSARDEQHNSARVLRSHLLGLLQPYGESG